MLLLLRGTPGTLTATIAGIGAVVASGSTVSATIAGMGSVGLPESIELMVFADIGGVGGVTAISQGFLTRTATVAGEGSVVAFGGYGATLNFSGIGGVTATVGSFFDGGAVTLAGIGTVSGAGVFTSAAFLAGFGSLSAIPVISGGTISSAATVAGIGIVTGAIPIQMAIGSLEGMGDILAIPSVGVPNLATQMRLSFGADDMRLTFRKG